MFVKLVTVALKLFELVPLVKVSGSKPVTADGADQVYFVLGGTKSDPAVVNVFEKVELLQMVEEIECTVCVGFTVTPTLSLFTQPLISVTV